MADLAVASLLMWLFIFIFFLSACAAKVSLIFLASRSHCEPCKNFLAPQFVTPTEYFFQIIFLLDVFTALSQGEPYF